MYVPKGSPTLDGCAICVPTDGTAGVQFDKTALEPRIGLAWKPMGSDKTVSAPDMRSSTIPPGTKVRKAYGRILRTMPRRITAQRFLSDSQC